MLTSVKNVKDISLTGQSKPHIIVNIFVFDTKKAAILSEGRFELPPTEVDCDLNAAP